VFATLTALSASGSPYAALDLLRRMEVPMQGFRFGPATFDPPYLPLSLYRDEALKKLQEKMAEDWVTDNMITLRDALATSKAKGKFAVEHVLNEYAGKFGLERVKTDMFYGRYTLAQAPELAPFVDSYKKNYSFINLIEGRTGPKALKEEDFYKLFESGEPFAPVENTKPRPGLPI